jgi:hypothetical protein
MPRRDRDEAGGKRQAGKRHGRGREEREEVGKKLGRDRRERRGREERGKRQGS